MLDEKDNLFQSTMVKYFKFYLPYLEVFVPIWHVLCFFYFIGHIMMIFIFNLHILSALKYIFFNFLRHILPFLVHKCMLI